jgi:acetyl esterase/lipase
MGVLKAVVDYFSAQYLQGRDPQHPLASPLFGNLADLPPLLMQVSSNELVTDDSIRFAEKARAAGVDVQLDAWPQLTHVWQGFVPHLPEARQAIDRVGAFIKAI